MQVPVELRGTACNGNLLEESTHTGVVGVLGAMIWTSRMLQFGTEVHLINRFSQQSAKFRVAWVKAQQNGGLWETGLESQCLWTTSRKCGFLPRPVINRQYSHHC